VPVTHPNDLFAGEPASFQLLQDGKPASNMEVSLIPGGIRYRDQLNEMKVKTDEQGKFTATFPAPGMYWMNATTGGGRPGGAEGPGGGPRATNGGGRPGPRGPMRFPTGDRASYTATIEVLPQ